MKTISVIQGSKEWHEHRASYFNASDSPVMLGVSPYKSRDELLHEIFTGLTKEVDKFQQQRFDDGHRFEALDRPNAEEVIGEALYPVTGVEGIYSASFDGLTMNEDIAYEHKTLNDSIRKVEMAGDLPELYRIQMEQQLLVSGAEKVLFRATKWEGDNLVEHKQFWYTGSAALRERIIKGWEQFAIDLSNYVPPAAAKEKPKAEVAEAFPIVSILAKGELVTCNLDEITPRFDKFLSETNTTLATDEDFVQGEADAKASREAAKTLLMTAKAVINQMLPVSDAVSQLEAYAAKFNALGLQLEKAVKEQKESIKTQAITAARNAFNDYCRELSSELSPITVLWDSPDFAGSIKGLKTLASMHAAINTALANGKIESNGIAKDLRNKIVWWKLATKDHTFLFTDIQQIIFKLREDFELTVTTRIKDYEAEKAAKAVEDAKNVEPEVVAPTAEVRSGYSSVATEAPAPKTVTTTTARMARPSNTDIIDAVAEAFDVDVDQALTWLRDMELSPA